MSDRVKFQKRFDDERKRVDRKLAKALQKRKPESLYNPGAYILESPGKRLRPLLVLFSAEAVGGAKKHCYNAALAVEMLHNFTLVHDDIMDNSDKRRGRLTLHKKYDVNTAILVGDSLLSVAYEYLLTDVRENAAPVIAAFSKALVEVCEGQSYDKDFELRKEVSIREYKLMIKKKTAAMAEMCCEIGARLGGGSDAEIKALANYGRKIGMAFQIQDDLLDIAGETENFGKNIGGDLVEGKKTYLFLKALEKAGTKEKTLLTKVIKNKGIDKKDIPLYKNLYEELGVLDDARKEVSRFTSSALSSLSVLKRTEDRELFSWLANSLLKRTK